ncbi:MAG: DUF937 domain-containing protein [Nitratireductor sp.]|nr:DUF937 domain-containing protein [Nitratireductor sp.]MCB1457856.1 DUF937 domain-containing protein [Nitratireductor sp.]
MLPLMEMLTQGANGQMVDQIARQYQLSRTQAQQAMEALLPAFSQGLKRNVSDPAGMMKLMAALSAGNHGQFHDNPAQAFSPQGLQEGNQILGELFGSKDLSRAVAANAAQVTGLSQSILKSLLPALAPMIMGGLFKQMTGNLSPAQTRPASAQASAGNPFGRIFEEMLKGGLGTGTGAGSSQTRDQTPGNPWGRILEEMTGGGRQQTAPQKPDNSNPWGRILEEMMGGGRPGAPAERAGPQGDNPLGRIFEEMMRGGGMAQQTGRPPEESYEPEPEPAQPRQRKGGFEDIFGEMFETGKTVQKDYQRNVESIFDEFLGGMRKR